MVPPSSLQVLREVVGGNSTPPGRPESVGVGLELETVVLPPFCGKSTFLDCVRAAASCGLGLQVLAGKSPGVGRERAAVGREACWEL